MDLETFAKPEAGKTSSVETGSIESVIRAFEDFRAAVSELFHSVGVDATQTRESARALGLNRGLAWRLSRVVRSPDAPEVISDVPGRPSVTKFFAACRERGASSRSIDVAQSAFEAYESAVGACSGDRKTLAMLMANRASGGPSGEAERARRKLFEGAAALWGGQTQLRFVTVFAFPAPDAPEMLDAVHVTGYVGFRRLIPRAWPMYYEAVHSRSGDAVKFTKRPLDPTGSSEGELQLVRQFCDPQPKIQVNVIGGFRQFELAPGPVGNEGLTTCVFGSYLHHLFPRYSDEPNTAGFMVLLQTPAERVLFDMYVHRDFAVPEPPRAQLLDRLLFPHGYGEDDFHYIELPIIERPSALPPRYSGAIYPLIPWYGRLLTFMVEHTGRPFDEFEGSRFEMTYPPISTTLSRRFDLNARPPAAE